MARHSSVASRGAWQGIRQWPAGLHHPCLHGKAGCPVAMGRMAEASDSLIGQSAGQLACMRAQYAAAARLTIRRRCMRGNPLDTPPLQQAWQDQTPHHCGVSTQHAASPPPPICTAPLHTLTAPPPSPAPPLLPYAQPISTLSRPPHPPLRPPSSPRHGWFRQDHPHPADQCVPARQAAAWIHHQPGPGGHTHALPCQYRHTRHGEIGGRGRAEGLRGHMFYLASRNLNNLGLRLLYLFNVTHPTLSHTIPHTPSGQVQERDEGVQPRPQRGHLDVV